MTTDSENLYPPPKFGITSEIQLRARELFESDLDVNDLIVAKHCILDWLGVAIAGSAESVVRILVDEATTEGGSPQATVLQRAERFTTRQAALINGAMGHALDYDDVNVAAQGHVTAVVLPAVLAIAQQKEIGGERFLKAFVAGYEAAVMLGLYVGRAHSARGFHSTATVGSIGAAVACALLEGLTPTSFATAIGIAATMAAGLKAQFGTMCKPLHAGRASENGLVAAKLALLGLQGRADVLEAPNGFATTLGGTNKTQSRSPRLGTHAYVRDTLFKFSASCFGTHGAIGAISQLLQAESLNSDKIKSVVLRVDAGADSMCNISKPRTASEAKFSLTFNAALAIAGEDTFSPSTFSDAMTQRADLCRLRDMVSVIPMHHEWPQMLTEVDIYLSDGQLLRAQCDTGRPLKDLAVQQEKITQKFHALSEPVIGASRAKQLASAVANFESIANINEVTDILC